MEQDYHLAQNIVGAPAAFLKIWLLRAVALVNLSRAKCIQRLIALKLSQEVGLAHQAHAIELERPNVALSCLGKYCLKVEREASAVVVASESIASIGITDSDTDCALAARRVPNGTCLALCQDALSLWQFGGIRFQALVCGVYHMEQRVGSTCLPEQPAIEAHPLGTSQRGSLHIVGSKNDRYAQTLNLLEVHALVRTKDYGIGLEGYYALHVGAHRVSAILYLAFRAFGESESSLYVLDKDILGIADANYSVCHAKILHELTMRRGKHHDPLKRLANLQGLKGLTLLPGVRDANSSVLGVHSQQLGIAKPRISIFLINGCPPSA